MKQLLAATIIAILACACTPGAGEYSGFETLPEQGWAYGDAVTFTPVDTLADPGAAIQPQLPVPLDSSATGQLSIAVVHDNLYPYSNLWLEVSYPRGGATARDTVEMTLCDDYGHWRGSGLGASYQLSATLPHRVTLAPRDTVAVRHIMRLDTLRHISRIGLDFRP